MTSTPRTNRPATAATYAGLALTVIAVVMPLADHIGVWAVKKNRWWAPWASAAMLVLVAIIAVTGLVIKDTSGDAGLPPLLGWVGVLPVIAGAVAVALLLTRPVSPQGRSQPIARH